MKKQTKKQNHSGVTEMLQFFSEKMSPECVMISAPTGVDAY